MVADMQVSVYWMVTLQRTPLQYWKYKCTHAASIHTARIALHAFICVSCIDEYVYNF